MKFRVMYQQPMANAQSPVRVIEQASGREIGWINRFLDREYVRRVAERTLRINAYNLLHFVRWWESVHHREMLRNPTSLNPRCSTMSDSSPANSLDLPVRRSTIVWRSRIVPSETSSPALLAKAHAGFISRSSAVDRWALAARE